MPSPTELVSRFLGGILRCLSDYRWFLPVSLLTPMAQDLGISEGVPGNR